MISLKNLKWGVLLIPALLPAYLLKAKVSWIPTTFLELSLYLVFFVAILNLIGVIFKAKIKTEKIRQLFKTFWEKTKWFNLFTGLLLLAAIIGTVVSDDKQLSLGILKAWFFDPILYFYLIIFVLDKRTDFKKLFYLMLIPGALVAVWGVVQYLSGDLLVDGRVRVFFESPNYVSLYLGPLIITGLGLLIDQLFNSKQAWKFLGRLGIVLGLSLGLVLMGIVLLLTHSYAAWLAVFGGVLVVSMLIFKRNGRRQAPYGAWIYYLGLLGGVFIGILTQLNNPKLKAIWDFSGSSSMHKRLQIWEGSVWLIKGDWLFGIGLGRFQEVYSESIPLIFNKPPLDWIVLHSHNLFLYFWLNLGVIGFLAFIGILVYLVYYFVKIAKCRDVLRYVSTEYYILLGMLVVILVHGLLDTPYWKNDLAILFWIVVSGVVWLYNFKFKNK